MTLMSADALATRRAAGPADRGLIVAAVVCALLVVLAIVGPLITPYPAGRIDILAIGTRPGPAHLLGVDTLGRDIFSRVLAGGRLSFAGPGIVLLVSMVLGTALGLIAAWQGGIVDLVLSRALDVLFALPGVLVAIVAAAVFGVGFWSPVLALSLVYAPYVARVVRSAAMKERSRPYVEACELAGMSAWRICTRHLLRNVMPTVLAQATVTFSSALMDFGATSFLGVGVRPPAVEWGLMVSDGRVDLLTGQLAQSASAGAMIVISVIAFNVLGERLSSRLEGRS